MHLATPVVFFALFATITIAIDFNDGKRRKGGKGNHDSSDYSSSSSSEEYSPRFPRPSGPSPASRGECDDGWLKFERDSGVWCIFVGYPRIIDGMLGQPTAESLCQTMNATLTGYQNDNERVTTANDALKKLIAGGQATIAGLWLGATNVPACRQRSCGPLNTFVWTDGHTTGTGGFSKWANGGPTVCIQQFIMTLNWRPLPGDIEAWRPYFFQGDLDRFACHAPSIPRARMYACGKVGVRRRTRG